MNDCRGQLLQRVRRGHASEQERAAFDAHLGTCESCRAMLELADDFDQVGEADPEDAERVARIAAKARKIHERCPPVSRLGASRLAWRLAAAAVVLAGAAGAGVLGWNVLRSEPHEAGAPVTDARTSPWGAIPRASESPRRAAAPESTEEADPPVKAPSSQSAAVPKRPAVGSPPTAEGLYRRANQARRAGQLARAVASYQELQRQFPGAAEARLSHVSLGRLLLDHGSTGGALAQFDAYLAGGSGQRLAAEALFGRGQTLRALGRREEEAQNWRRLLGQYPDSAYATHAKRRLEELD